MWMTGMSITAVIIIHTLPRAYKLDIYYTYTYFKTRFAQRGPSGLSIGKAQSTKKNKIRFNRLVFVSYANVRVAWAPASYSQPTGDLAAINCGGNKGVESNNLHHRAPFKDSCTVSLTSDQVLYVGFLLLFQKVLILWIYYIIFNNDLHRSHRFMTPLAMFLLTSILMEWP